MSGLTEFLMREVEMPLVAIVADLEDAGYPVDVAFFRALKERLRPDLAELLQQIQATAGANFNPNSPPQLRRFRGTSPSTSRPCLTAWAWMFSSTKPTSSNFAARTAATNGKISPTEASMPVATIGPHQPEIYEWWRVTDGLAPWLAEIGECILDNSYGYWWGRQATGQQMIMDGTLQRRHA
jgi:hypothetical protein